MDETFCRASLDADQLGDDAKIEIADYEKYLLLKRDDEFRIGKQTEDTWDNAKARLIEKIRGL